MGLLDHRSGSERLEGIAITDRGQQADLLVLGELQLAHVEPGHHRLGQDTADLLEPGHLLVVDAVEAPE
eukprot:12230763-Alexandrium_andersonii.AAC.1